MSDLQLGAPEEGGKGKAVALATVVLLAIAAAAYWFTPHTTTKITVTRERLIAPHIENRAMPGAGPTVVGTPASIEDSLYVVVDLAIANQRGEPLFITAWTSTATLADGSLAEATVVTAPDFDRVEPSFPALTPLLTHPLTSDASIASKSTLNGTVLLLFPGLNEATWRAKHDAKLTLQLAHGDPQDISLP